MDDCGDSHVGDHPVVVVVFFVWSVNQDKYAHNDKEDHWQHNNCVGGYHQNQKHAQKEPLKQHEGIILIRKFVAVKGSSELAKILRLRDQKHKVGDHHQEKYDTQ